MFRHILFDLDSTLYSVLCGFEERLTIRAREFASSFLGLPMEESDLLRNEGLNRYGNTIGWLTHEKAFLDKAAFYAYVYPEEEIELLESNPELRPLLESLPYPCSILTNSPAFHAHRVIKKLGLEGFFKLIFDIEANALRGKPHPSTYRQALDALGLKAEEVLFIDDSPRNVIAYNSLGGRGLLLDERDFYKDFPYERIKSLKELKRYL